MELVIRISWIGMGKALARCLGPIRHCCYDLQPWVARDDSDCTGVPWNAHIWRARHSLPEPGVMFSHQIGKFYWKGMFREAAPLRLLDSILADLSRSFRSLCHCWVWESKQIDASLSAFRGWWPHAFILPTKRYYRPTVNQTTCWGHSNNQEGLGSALGTLSSRGVLIRHNVLTIWKERSTGVDVGSWNSKPGHRK